MIEIKVEGVESYRISPYEALYVKENFVAEEESLWLKITAPGSTGAFTQKLKVQEPPPSRS